MWSRKAPPHSPRCGQTNHCTRLQACRLDLALYCRPARDRDKAGPLVALGCQRRSATLLPVAPIPHRHHSWLAAIQRCEDQPRRGLAARYRTMQRQAPETNSCSRCIGTRWFAWRLGNQVHSHQIAAEDCTPRPTKGLSRQRLDLKVHVRVLDHLVNGRRIEERPRPAPKTRARGRRRAGDRLKYHARTRHHS